MSNPITHLTNLITLFTDSRSFLSQLSTVVSSGVTTLIWSGDADWICNWFGDQAAAEAVSYPGQSQFQSLPLEPYTVNGNQSGTFKNVGGLSFLRVFGAGHEVPYYRKISPSKHRWQGRDADYFHFFCRTSTGIAGF